MRAPCCRINVDWLTILPLTHPEPQRQRICWDAAMKRRSKPRTWTVPAWLTAAAAGGAFAAVALAESRRPLRRRREARHVRFGRNVTTGLLSAAATTAIE